MRRKTIYCFEEKQSFGNSYREPMVGANRQKEQNRPFFKPADESRKGKPFIAV